MASQPINAILLIEIFERALSERHNPDPSLRCEQRGIVLSCRNLFVVTQADNRRSLRSLKIASSYSSRAVNRGCDQGALRMLLRGVICPGRIISAVNMFGSSNEALDTATVKTLTFKPISQHRALFCLLV